MFSLAVSYVVSNTFSFQVSLKFSDVEKMQEKQVLSRQPTERS